VWSVRKQDIMCVRLFNFGHNEHCRALRQHDERRIPAASAASANGEAFRHAVVASHRVSRGAAGSLHELTKEPSSSSKPHSTLSAPIHGRSLTWAFLASACFSSSAVGESRTWLIHDAAGSLLPPLCWSSTALGRAIAESRRSTVIVTVLPW